MFHSIKDTEFTVLKKNELLLDKAIKECVRIKEHFGGKDFFEIQRCAQLKNMRNGFKNIWENIAMKKESAKNKELKTEEELKTFKEDMVTLKSLIDEQKKNVLKELWNLQQKSVDLNAELIYFREKLPCWKQHTKNSANLNNFVKTVAKPKQKFQEINNYFDFVHASGGKEGGWRREDHFLFLKFLIKYKKVDVVAKSINEMLPDISMEEVYDHFQWFVHYQNLLKAKKEVILKWKEGKTIDKKSNKRIVHKDETNREKIGFKIPTENLEVRLKLWREQKKTLIENQKELEKQKLKEQKEREQRRKQKQHEIKEMVNHWKNTKQTLEEAEKKEKENLKMEETKNRSRTAKKLIKQFQSMDELRIQKSRDQKLKNENVPEAKRTQSGPLERIYSQRNPQRLLKPTQQWINRVHGSCDEPIYEKPTARTVLKMPKLLIPDWRKTIQ